MGLGGLLVAAHRSPRFANRGKSIPAECDLRRPGLPDHVNDLDAMSWHAQPFMPHFPSDDDGRPGAGMRRRDLSCVAINYATGTGRITLNGDCAPPPRR